MIEIPLLNDFFKVIKRTSIDDVVDRLSYFWTASLLTFFALLTGGKQMFGKPIECMFPPEFPGTWVDYAREYCYITSTYFRRLDDKWTAEQKEDSVVEGYYQWVPFILALQALSVYVPHLLWKVFQRNETIDFEHVVTQAKALRYMVDEKRQKSINDIVDYLRHRLQYQKSSPGVSYAGFGCRSSVLHISAKVLTFAALFGNIWFMNTYFGHGRDSFWGYTAAYNTMTNASWNETGVFPRITFCDFQTVRSNQNSVRTVQCVLMVNMLNEKIFIFAWFWFALAAITALINVVYTCLTLFLPSIRRSTARFYLRPLRSYGSVNASTSSSSYQDYDNDFIRFISLLDADGVHLLNFVRNHAGALVASQIACALCDSLHNPETQSEDSGAVFRRPTHGPTYL